jgi:hypothetical protein
MKSLSTHARKGGETLEIMPPKDSYLARWIVGFDLVMIFMENY